MGHFEFEPEALSTVLRSKRFLAIDRAAVDIDAIGTWDDHLLRDMRLLVPIDVQALFVPQGGDEPMVRLPLLLAEAGAEPAAAMPEPFAPGTPRDAGVHLHWAMPDALLRGTFEKRDDGSANRLGLRPLPDRWVVLRILLPNDAAEPSVRGWVIEADRAVAVPLEQWSEGSTASQAAAPAGIALTPDQLTGAVGGSVAWASVYDAVLNRFAFHDPLDDVAEIAPGGVDQDAATYIVAGWWRDPAVDPLDAARSSQSLGELLESLRWRQLTDWGNARSSQLERTSDAEIRRPLGLETLDRFGEPRPSSARGFAAPRIAGLRAPFSPIDRSVAEPYLTATSSKFAAETFERYTAEPWHLRSSLLHGAVYGVPVVDAPPVDQRPAGQSLRVSLGRHDDDVIAALASVPGAPASARRDTERLLAAFTAQKINRIGTSDGAVEIEEHEHAAAFASLPGGTAGTDRFVSGGQEGTAFAGRNARRATVIERGQRKTARGAVLDSTLLFSATKRYDLVEATESQVHALMRLDEPDDERPADPRVVARPAPRFTFPVDPLVAIQGAGRSLRHGGDGRASPDGKLTCRWPTQVITEVQGVVTGDRVLRSLGNGSIPEEVVLLAREALLQDPYHVRWLTRAPATSGESGLVARRLQAEAVLRFGRDGTYDGATQAFTAKAAPLEQRWAGDELRRFSLVKGADPDPVGVTAWSQPWVPLWIEWEVELATPAEPSLDGWSLADVDLATSDAPQAALPPRAFKGRTLLTTGAATTLRRAVTDWLAAEDARDLVGSGEATDETETALRSLAAAVVNVDIVTATLDGLRHQLLGLPVADGLRRATDGNGGIALPAPTGPPTLLVGGGLRIVKARLVDAFGRLLDVPLDDVATTVDTSVEEEPGTLQVRPRLTRPCRWQFLLVDAASPTGAADAAEARVDQVDPTLTVNPVAGFLLPDHLDESLEVFDVNGSPLGELLHEAVGGSVVWEIAAGREGPPDAGPSYGLGPAQQSLGWLAAGLVAVDAAGRAGPETPPESALSALLRAIDTTLWTVDTFALLGSEHVAGLVGRPIAVTRAQLRLELRPENDLDLSDPARAAERLAAERALAAVAFPVRVGELTRTDDGVLGFFVDDDYSRFRLVDKTVAAFAPESGRSRGQLGLLGRSDLLPPTEVITHPYVVGSGESDTLYLHLGQTVTLTLLMHPAGRAHVTSGILPRKSLALARDWVGSGMAAIAPSLRTGPLLVETDLAAQGQVRLPKVSVFGQNQAFLWRDTPATWRTDAILAATQTALLPETPAAFREGWVRVVPDDPGGEP